MAQRPMLPQWRRQKTDKRKLTRIEQRKPSTTPRGYPEQTWMKERRRRDLRRQSARGLRLRPMRSTSPQNMRSPATARGGIAPWSPLLRALQRFVANVSRCKLPNCQGRRARQLHNEPPSARFQKRPAGWQRDEATTGKLQAGMGRRQRLAAASGFAAENSWREAGQESLRLPTPGF